MSRYRNSSSVASLDVTTNTLMGFIILFILSFILAVLAKLQEEEKRIDTSGEYLILVIWDKSSDDDVDTHVRDPAGNHLFYDKREAGLMHLERDDRGKFNDVSQAGPDGKPIDVEHNEERAVIRGVVPGEYIVNIHMFKKAEQTLNNVKVSLIKLRGKDATVFEIEMPFSTQGDEQTAFRFTLKVDGAVTNINRLPRKFIGNPGQPPPDNGPENPDQNQEEPQ